MSKCISAQGEYSEHTPGEEEFVCGFCFVLDEDAIRGEIGRLRQMAALLRDIVGGDYGTLCDHPADCGCTAAQAMRLLDIVPESERESVERVEVDVAPEVVDLVAALRATVEAAAARRRAAE